MALKSRATKATYSFDGNSVKLVASFKNLETLRDRVDSDPISYIASTLEPLAGEAPDLAEAGRRVMNVLVSLQESDYEYGDLHDAFLGNYVEFFSEDNMKELAKTVGFLLGQDISEKIAQAEAELGPKDEKKGA